MHTVTIASAFVLAAVVLMAAPQNVDAVCCTAGRTANGLKICGDCLPHTPYCGVGKCNIFGCACDGGCRHGICYIFTGKRSVDEKPSFYNAESIVSAGDLNGDGVLSFEEAETMLEQQQGPSVGHLRSVQSLDKNLDGLLSTDEIDY